MKMWNPFAAHKGLIHPEWSFQFGIDPVTENWVWTFFFEKELKQRRIFSIVMAHMLFECFGKLVDEAAKDKYTTEELRELYYRLEFLGESYSKARERVLSDRGA